MPDRPRIRSDKAATGPTKRRGSKASPPTKGNAGTPSSKAEKLEVRIFVSYSHVDSAARAKLETHLAPLKQDGVSTWFDGNISPGDKLDTDISRALRQAHLFVALLSPEYLNSHYCWRLEYQRAMNRRARGTMRVVAVVVRPCDWKATRAAGFKLSPRDGRPVTGWRSADAAFLNVVEGIRVVVKSIRKQMTEAPAKPPRAPRTAKAAVAAKRTRGYGTKADKKPARSRMKGGKAKVPTPKMSPRRQKG